MLTASDFADMAYDFPQGCHWPGDSARMVRRVVARLQTLFLREGARLILALDEPDSEGAPPSGVVLVAEDRTAVVPLQCRKHVIRIDGEPVYCGDTGAVMRVAREIASVVEWYAAQLCAPRDKK
jgi:hypothetical protein